MSDTTIAKDVIMIERTFNAPVDLIWKMWTQREHFKNWYGPQGFAISIAEMDVRVGGKHLFCMESLDGIIKFWLTGEYTEVVLQERRVYTDSMADENGNVLSPSTDRINEGDYPTITVVTVQLEALEGRTKMVMTHAGVPADEGGASEGWEQTFAKMADHIESILSDK